MTAPGSFPDDTLGQGARYDLRRNSGRSESSLETRGLEHVQLTSDSLRANEAIPDAFAFAKPDAENHAALSDNRNPHLAWSDVPDGCRSFVVLCIDVDAPTVADDVNKEGRSVPEDLPRGDFVHWAMIDLPADCREIAEGACSDGVTPRGKADPRGPDGARQGKNDYTGWFAGDPEMAGTYLGYDGPAPPWNDERVHYYHFQVLALDIESVDVGASFTADEVKSAIEGRVLASAELVGSYTNNPNLRD